MTIRTKRWQMIVAAVMGLALCAVLAGQDAPTGPNAKKAQSMVKEGLSFWAANGKDKSIAAFNDVAGKFRDGEFYLFVFDYAKSGTAVCIARGDGNKALINKDMWAQKDPDGEFYIQGFVSMVTKSTKGWVDYKRSNPETKKIEPKSSYVENIPGTTILIGCGFYKD